jgi:formylglycine-generating enzyme required for sulfatase activity
MEENDERGLFRKDKTTNKPLLGKNYLFAIGINDYEHEKKLQFAVSDVLAVRDLLWESYGFERLDEYILIDKDATRAHIKSKFILLKDEVTENDSLLIYFAGHGIEDKNTKQGYWLPVDGRQDERHLTNNEIIGLIEGINSKHTLLVSDSCFSGTLLYQTRDVLTERYGNKPSRWVFTSGRDELVKDKSPFAEAFIECLQHNSEEELLLRYVIEKVQHDTVKVKRAIQTPLAGRLHGVDKNLDGEFVFYRNKNIKELRQENLSLKEKIEDLEKELVSVKKKPVIADTTLLKQRDRKIFDLDEENKELKEENHELSLKVHDLEVQISALRDKNGEYSQQIKDLRKESAALKEINNLSQTQNNTLKQQIGNLQKENITLKEQLAEKEEIKKTLIVQVQEKNKNPLIIPLSDKINIDMIYVEGGTFEMGYKAGRDGENKYMDNAKLHQVSVDSFYMGKFTITQEQYYAVMDKDSNSKFKGERLPVETISWDNTKVFIEKINQKTGKKFRLPSEAEWEYAARGGNTPSQQGRGQGGGAYMYAGSNNIDEVAWYDKNSDGKTHEVGLKKPNELGIYDMSGNVWEWCEDYYDKMFYEKSAGAKNPVNKTQSDNCVYRGGSWYHNSGLCRVARRDYDSPSLRDRTLGFRLVLSL